MDSPLLCSPTVLPSSVRYVPAGQLPQAVLPVPVTYFPEAQMTQSLDEYEFEVAEDFPATQPVHIVAPVSEFV